MCRRTPRCGTTYGFGLLYIVLSVYSLVVGVGSAANFLSLNVMGAWGFMILGVAMVVAGWLMSGIWLTMQNPVSEHREKGSQE